MHVLELRQAYWSKLPYLINSIGLFFCMGFLSMQETLAWVSPGLAGLPWEHWLRSPHCCSGHRAPGLLWMQREVLLFSISQQIVLTIHINVDC